VSRRQPARNSELTVRFNSRHPLCSGVAGHRSQVPRHTAFGRFAASPRLASVRRTRACITPSAGHTEGVSPWFSRWRGSGVGSALCVGHGSAAVVISVRERLAYQFADVLVGEQVVDEVAFAAFGPSVIWRLNLQRCLRPMRRNIWPHADSYR
jgi:hypothetical protein